MTYSSDTKYVKTQGGYVAYRVFGSGPIDILFISNWCQNVELMMEEPSLARFINTLASAGRVICFDKRGSGMSDPVPLSAIPTVEDWMDDAREVMDDIGSESVFLIGDTEGGPMAMLFAATYPNRTTSLTLVNTFARFIRDDDYPEGMPRATVDKMTELYEHNWGTSGFIPLTAPSAIGDRRFGDWFAKYQRQCMPLGASIAVYKWIIEFDIRSILPTIRVPTLVLHRADNQHYRVDFGRYIARNIPDAKLIEIPGADCFPYHAGDPTPVLNEILEFITGNKNIVEEDRVLTTLMFTDMVGSTALASKLGDKKWGDILELHHKLVRSKIEQFQGEELQTTGDGFLVIFNGPARAIRCAKQIAEDIRTLDIDVRIGLHTGEITLYTDQAEGIAIHIAARVMAIAGPREVLVSRTVRDLVVGSGISFNDRGTHQFKGVPDSWQVFSVEKV